MSFRTKWRRAAVDIGVIAALLWGLSYLPPDTSWKEREKIGVLRYCVSDLRSPLITDADGGSPGPELDLVQKIAQDIGLKLQVIEAHNIGRSFNPADWNITRGQCDLLGGGLADTRTNRGFVTLLPTGQSLGLHLLGAQQPVSAGQEVGVYMGSAGIDRLRLSSWMRQQGWRASALRDEAALRAWLAQGKVAIAPSLVEVDDSVAVEMLPFAAADVSPLALALWRGDMTLTRKIRTALEKNLEN